MIQCGRTTQGMSTALRSLDVTLEAATTGSQRGGAWSGGWCLPEHLLLSCLSALLQLREKPGEVGNDPGREGRSLQFADEENQGTKTFCNLPDSMYSCTNLHRQQPKHELCSVGFRHLEASLSHCILACLTLHLCLCST